MEKFMQIHDSRMGNILNYSHPILMLPKNGNQGKKDVQENDVRDKNDSEDKLEKNY